MKQLKIILLFIHQSLRPAMLMRKRLKPRKVISMEAGSLSTSKDPSKVDQAPWAGEMIFMNGVKSFTDKVDWVDHN